MFKKIVFYDSFTESIAGTWSSFLLQGLIFILFGAMVVMFPQIIAAMVAAAFIFIGLIFVSIAFKTRSLRKRYNSLKNEYWEPL